MDTVLFADITDSIEQYNTVGFDWDEDIPFVSTPVVMGGGLITSFGSGSVVSWNLSGQAPINHAIAWRRCGMLLTRM